MDRVSSSSQLSSASSSSSLPPMASRPSSADLGAPSESLPEALRPQETQTTSNAEIMTTTMAMDTSARRASPFKSFQSLNSSGPFRPLFHVIAAISIAFLYSATVVAAAAAGQQTNRKLEDEWTGEWNGEWQANDDQVYECGDNCGGDDGTQKDTGMWIESDVVAEGMAAWTPDQIITYVSIGIMSFMTLLCCVCYPEILVVGYANMCGCCCGVTKGMGVRGDAVVDDDDVEGDYVGGKQEKQERKKKKKRRSSRSGSRSSRKNVELV